MLDPFTCASKLPVTGHWWLGACNRWKDESECAHDRASGASVSLCDQCAHGVPLDRDKRDARVLPAASRMARGTALSRHRYM